MAYYGAQQGLPDVPSVGSAATVRPAAPSEDAALIAELEHVIRTQAALVVVCSDTRRYTNPAFGFPMYRSGTALADTLLADPELDAVDQFQIGGVPFTILVNRALR